MFNFTEPAFWLTLAIIFLIIEFIGAGSLYATIFTLAALITAFGSLFINNVFLLVIIFVVSTLACLVTIKPLLEKITNISKNTGLSNIDSIIGTTGYIQETITSKKKGTVLVNHEEWSAASTEELELTKDTKVIIDRVVGATLYVSKFKKEMSEE